MGRWFLVMFLCCAATGCVFVRGNEDMGPAPEDPYALDPGEYAARIGRLEQKLDAVQDDVQRADLHLMLGQLYSSSRNQGRDYEKARRYFHQYELLRAEGANRVLAESWLRVLNQLPECEKDRTTRDRCAGELKRTTEELEGEKDALAEATRNNDALEQKVKALQKEIRQLEEKIEKLKYLDLRLEEKRRSYK